MDLFSVYNNINWSQSLSWKFCTEIGEERCFNSFWEDGKNWVFGEDRIPLNLTEPTHTDDPVPDNQRDH